MIHIVLGTKAQLIKTAPVMVELKKRKIPFNFIFTGQHQETMDELRKIFKIKDPDITLYKGKDITSVPQMIFWMFRILFQTAKFKKKIFQDDREGIVLVHGDTFSTLLGVLMGKIAHLKVGHIESGLRSFKLFHPFPEEITRLLVFRLSDVFFCPGTWAENNLKKYKGIKINTKENSLLDALNLALKNSNQIKVNIPKEKYCLVSVHRFENIFNKKMFEKIIRIIEMTSKRFRVLIIMHPPTEKNLKKYGFYNRLLKNKNIELRPRYDYFQFIKLLKNSEFLMTDGGSNQEECYFLGHPCLLLREATERKEGLGKNVMLSRYSRKKIHDFIENYKNYKKESFSKIKKYPSEIMVDYLEMNFVPEIISGEEYLRTYFDQMAYNKISKSRHFKNQLSNVMDMVLPIKKNEKILDIGTGMGTFAFECAKIGASVTGTDLSHFAIEACQKEATKNKFKNAKFLYARSDKQPFLDNSFDKIIMADLVEHLPTQLFYKSLNEAYRVLKEGGLLIVYTPNRNHFLERLRSRNIILKKYKTHVNLMNEQEIKAAFGKTSFEIIKIKQKSSHIPIISFLERIFMKIPNGDRLFSRRISLIAQKPINKKNKIKDFYEDFHQLPNHPLNQLMEKTRYNLLKSRLKNVCGKILVIGCGSKDEMGIIPKNAQGIGLDLSREAVKKSKKAYPRFKYVVGDACNLPFADKSFDAIVSSEVIEHVPSDKKMMSEVFRILKDNGTFIVTTPNWLSWYGLARWGAEKMFKRPFTADNQPIDNWVIPNKFVQKLQKAGFQIQKRLGMWYFPPTGKGRVRIPDFITMPFVYLFWPLEILLRRTSPNLGHTVFVVAQKSIGENVYENNTLNDQAYWQKRIKDTDVSIRSVGCQNVSNLGNQYIYKMVKERYQKVLKFLNLPKNSKVLDAGSGIGEYVSNFKKAGLSDITCADVSADALETLKKNHPNAKIIQSKIADLKLPSNSFELVHCFDVLYHILSDREWARSLKNLARMSKKYIVLHEIFPRYKPLFVSRHLNPRTYEETTKLLKKAGYREVYSKPTHVFASFLYFRFNNIWPKKLYNVDRFIFKTIDKFPGLNYMASHHIKVFEKTGK